VVGKGVGAGDLKKRVSPGERVVGVAGVRGQPGVEGRVAGARVVVAVGVGMVQVEGQGPGRETRRIQTA
jgi:hypothetical protein